MGQAALQELLRRNVRLSGRLTIAAAVTASAHPFLRWYADAAGYHDGALHHLLAPASLLHDAFGPVLLTFALGSWVATLALWHRVHTHASVSPDAQLG